MKSANLYPASAMDHILQSAQYGEFNLARKEDRNRLTKVIIDLQRSTDRLIQHDISHWRQAWQMAIDVDNPNRSRLYDIYNDTQSDSHLSGIIGQLNGFVKARAFKLVNEKGEEDEDAGRILDNTWFKDLVDYILEARYWGHSLIELGEVITGADGRMAYDGVALIPRKHVVPEKGRVTRNAGEDWRSGTEYRTRPYSDWLIEAGKRDDLGLYYKAAKDAIAKKYAGAFWDTFAEIFGIPVRIAKTSTRDEKEVARLEGAMATMSTSQWMVTGDDTEVQFVESSRGDAFNVFDRRIDRANSEMSKLVLYQTMTADDGSSLSQSETHLEVLRNLVNAICGDLRDIINGQLLPKMALHGFQVKGLSFEWNDTESYSPEQMAAIESLVVNNYEVPGSYFEEKYGIPAGERRNQGITLPEPPQPSGGSKNGNLGQPESFFD